MNYEVNLTFKTDRNSLKRQQKTIDKQVGNGRTTNETGNRRKQRGQKGSFSSKLIDSIKQPLSYLSNLSGLSQVIRFLKNIAVVVTGLLKPFLALFIVLGFLLYKIFKDYKTLFGLGSDKEKKEFSDKSPREKASGLGSIVGVVAILGALIAGLSTLPAILLGALGMLAFNFGMWLGDQLYAFVMWIWDSAKKNFPILWNNLKQFASEMWTDLTNSFSALWTNIKSYASEFWTLLSDSFSALWTNITTFTNDFWTKLKTSFNSLWKKLKTFGKWFWETLKSSFSALWEKLKEVGTWMYDKLTTVLSSSLDTLSGIGSWIKGKIKGLLSFGSIGSSSGSRNINDGVITPRGEVVRTNPRDYIFATKNPESITQPNESNTIDINIEIKGNVDSNVYERMKRELAKELGARIRY